MDAPGISRNAAGKAIASAEVLIVAPVARKSDGLDAYVTLRGVGARGLELRPAIAFAGFNDRAINMIGSFNMPSQLVYQLAVTPESVGIAVGLAVLLGLLGGMLPAARAARISIAAGIRAR